MITRTAFALAFAALFSSAPIFAEEKPAAPKMTMGNGERNVIQMEGLKLEEGDARFSQVRVDGGAMSTFRGTTTALTFSEVTIEKPGWLVMHPVIDGRPDGDMVSGFAYLNAGKNEDVTIQVDHPAKPNDKFLVMLHTDVDQDRVFDFVFVEDGINVEDAAVFEGINMIAHIFAVPE